MVSQVLGERYELQRQLGKRAGRRTFLARDLETQELVVIKLLRFDSDFEWEDLKLFEREAETLKALNHPAIPRYLNYFEIDSPNTKGFALVQTYVEGQSLEKHLKAGRTFSEAEVKQLAKSLLKILIYLHNRQPPVIHRDIKPSNILLTNRSGNSVGDVYLVDFGSVQTLAAKEGGTITVVGTYGYMPQEQFGGRTVPASDLYSLGATLIYLVTGTHPADLPQKNFRLQFEQVCNLSPEFVRWLSWMTQPDLNKRLTSASEALQTLEQPLQREISLPVVQKLVNGRILLTKDTKFLEILIPPEGNNFSIVIPALCAIVCISFSIPLTAKMLFTPFPSNILYTWCWLFICPTCLSMAHRVLFSLFGYIRLHLNQQQITLTWELFDLKFHRPRPSSRHSITHLEYTSMHFAKNSAGDIVEVKPQITIWAGGQQYKLGGQIAGTISDLEIEWLANELSNWLRIPIKKRQLSSADR